MKRVDVKAFLKEVMLRLSVEGCVEMSQAAEEARSIPSIRKGVKV